MNWRGEYIFDDSGWHWLDRFHFDAPNVCDLFKFGMGQVIIDNAKLGVKVGQA